MMPYSVAIRLLTRRAVWLSQRIRSWEQQHRQPALHFRSELGALRVALNCLGADMEKVPESPQPWRASAEVAP